MALSGKFICSAHELCNRLKIDLFALNLDFLMGES